MNLLAPRNIGRLAFFYAWACGGALTLAALLTLFYIIFSGVKGFGLQLIFLEMQDGGITGGVRFQLVGTLILLATSLAICIPLALGVGITTEIYLKNHKMYWRIIYAVRSLSSIPPVIIGIFCMWTLGQQLQLGKSWLVGGIALSLMILPLASSCLIEAIRRVPTDQIEAATSLGASKEQIIWTLLIPRSLKPFTSGLFLGAARATGETAAVMLTAAVFSGAEIPKSINDAPVLTLSYHLFVLSQDYADPAATDHLWAVALLLLSMVSILRVISLRLWKGDITGSY